MTGSESIRKLRLILGDLLSLSPASLVDVTANDMLLMGEATQSNQSARLFKPISPLVAV
jgi:hypothetical protein